MELVPKLTMCVTYTWTANGIDRTVTDARFHFGSVEFELTEEQIASLLGSKPAPAPKVTRTKTVPKDEPEVGTAEPEPEAKAYSPEEVAELIDTSDIPEMDVFDV